MVGLLQESNKSAGQTGIEALSVAGIIISLVVVIGTFYFNDVSDQTTAIIMLKTELLEQFGSLGKNYVISSSLEPFILANGTLCFEVKTTPVLSLEDKAALEANSAEIKGKIAEKTKYKKIEIKLESFCA